MSEMMDHVDRDDDYRLIVNCQILEKLIHRYICVIILLIDLYIMYIMYTYLAIISQLVTCGDQYKLVKPNFPNILTWCCLNE